MRQGKKKAYLKLKDEAITAIPINWEDRLHGFDLTYEGKSGAITSRVLIGDGELFLFSVDQDGNLITATSNYDASRVEEMLQALTTLGFWPFNARGLIDKNQRIRLKDHAYKQFVNHRSELAERLSGHRFKIHLPDDTIDVAPHIYNDLEGVSESTERKLGRAKDWKLWRHYSRVGSLLTKNSEYIDAMVSAFVASEDTGGQSLVIGQTHDNLSCMGCGVSAATTVTTGWSLAFCFFGPIGCLGAAFTTGLELLATGISCRGCLHPSSSSSLGSGGSTPPPPDCAPWCT